MLRKVNSTIILHRKGIQEVHEPGALVDLTDKEYEELRTINPECLVPLDEAELALLEKQEQAAKQAAKKGANKPAGTDAGATGGEGEL